jgi:glucan biosynthesis protein C
MLASLTHVTTPLSWQAYPQLVGFGPIWFVAMLLIFDIGFAVWWAARRDRMPRRESSDEPPRYRGRVHPFPGLNQLFHPYRHTPGQIRSRLSDPVVPPPASQFLHHRHRCRPPQLVPERSEVDGGAGFILALIATITLFPLALTGGASLAGHGSWQSAAYALWDSTVAVGMALGMIALFHDRFNWSGSFTRFLQRHSYTAYIIQAPIIVFVAVALMGLSLEHLLKFGLATVIAVPLCFDAAYLVLKIPFAFRVL